MNFLAHIYLSGEDDQLMIGNFIADYVKGKKKDDYPDRIRKGIELHRLIDDYTDHHPITSESKSRLRPKYGKYSGVIVDLYYDYFLAKYFHEYSEIPLDKFSLDTYQVLLLNNNLLPEKVRQFLPYMIERNWLLNYASVEGIGRTLSGLSRRVSFENRMDESIQELVAHHAEFENEFRRFFPELITFANSRL
jgi:acyl carrier protein phosphodiesterase